MFSLQCGNELVTASTTQPASLQRHQPFLAAAQSLQDAQYAKIKITKLRLKSVLDFDCGCPEQLGALAISNEVLGAEMRRS